MKTFAFERRWLAAIFASVLPPSSDPRFPLGARSLGVERYVDALLRSAPRGFGTGLRVCTWMLQLCPPFVLGRFTWFTALAQDERADLLERLTESEAYLVRELPMLFKTAACLGLCGLPELQRRIGIHPVDATSPDWARATEAAHGLPVRAGDGS